MKILSIALTALLLVSCATGAQTLPASPATVAEVGTVALPGPDRLTQCTHKYSSRLSFSFWESKRVAYHPPMFPTLTVYHITDVSGVRWSVNEYEFQTYNCVTFQGK